MDTVHSEGKNDIGVYLSLTGHASVLFPVRVDNSFRLVHHDQKLTSKWQGGSTPGGVIFNSGAAWGCPSFISKDRIAAVDSPYVKVVQLPADAPPNPMPVIAKGTGFIDLTDDDLPPPPLVPVAVVTIVARFRLLPSV